MKELKDSAFSITFEGLCSACKPNKLTCSACKLNIYRVYMVIAGKCLQGEVEFALIFIPKN